MSGVAFESWPIARTKPGPRTAGRSLTVFIDNGSCHLTTVDVYADGAIDAWGFLDRDLFRGKLASRWVVPSPRPDQRLSVFDFGSARIEDARWFQTPESIGAAVEAVIRALNPAMRDLVDMQGSDTEVRGRARYAKMGLSDKKPCRLDGDREVLGDWVPVLRVLGDGFALTRLVTWADGMCQVGPDGALLPIAEVPSLYAAGRIASTAPAGSRVEIPGLGSFRVVDDFGWVDERDRIGQMHDQLGELNGRESVITRCARAFEAYEAAPSDAAKAALRLAYEAVPSHLRCYCGDMDTRDTAIRFALYGEDPDD